jgi:hypothetical protein
MIFDIRVVVRQVDTLFGITSYRNNTPERALNGMEPVLNHFRNGELQLE